MIDEVGEQSGIENTQDSADKSQNDLQYNSQETTPEKRSAAAH
jgi:hypothetical protein